MSLVSDERQGYDSSSTPSPDILSSKKPTINEYNTCRYRHGKYWCSKICTLAFFIIFSSFSAASITSLALYLDNWAGISTNPDAAMNLSYPKLGSNYLDYVMFNKTIPNDSGTMYKYIDESKTDVNLITTRFGLLSQCKTAVKGSRIDLFQTPWENPVCKASWNEYQCPIVAMRTKRGSRPRAPRGPSMNGCIKLTQVCDGNIDCPSGHDEMNCPETSSQCPPGMIKCSKSKPICIPKSSVCDGLNDCGMYEDEENCCGRVGFIRCADGSCVTGDKCDAKADCFDLSDEYDCPDPNSEFYSKCSDGQLIESTYKCEGLSYPSFQCNDLSDETRCDFNPQPLVSNPGIKSLEFDNNGKCFKQAFTFTALNESMLEESYPDENMRKFAAKYEVSRLRMVVVICIGIEIVLSLFCILLLLCIGCAIKRCKTIQTTFVFLAIIYMICLLHTLFIGTYWVFYVNALNEVVDNPVDTDIYEKVAIETMKATGGHASIRISAHLMFYNCGFFGLAFILSVIAARLARTASCHRQTTYEDKYRQTGYQDDPLATHRLLLSNRSTTNSDTGTATPEQTVYPHHRAFHYIDSSKHFQHSASDSQLQPSHVPPTANSTYMSFDKVDSLRSERLSPTAVYMQTRTLDRPPVRYTQV